MRVAVKPVITTGVALVGASVIAVTPIEPPAHATARAVEQDVSLTASSLAYVPINLIEQVFSAPANMVAALDRLATALVISGSWNESHPNNVWGWDPANPAMFREMINTLVPFPAFSQPWGEHLDWWVTANFPMYAGCAYECEDLPGMLDVMFKVPMSEFYSEQGYTFPIVINPIDGNETEWSGETIKLDPADPIRSVWNSLVGEPSGIKTVTWYEIVTAVANFGAALQVTGHLPDWVAVREIETFFKHFLRAPEAEEAVPQTEDEADSLPEASVLATDDSGPADLSVLTSFRALDSGTMESTATPEQDEESAADESLEADASVEAPAAEAPVVEKLTDELKKKFESAPAEEVTDESPDEEAADESADTDADDRGESDDAADESSKASESDTTKSPGGKHRKSDDSTDKRGSQDKSPSGSDSDKSGDSKSGDSSD